MPANVRAATAKIISQRGRKTAFIACYSGARRPFLSSGKSWQEQFWRPVLAGRSVAANTRRRDRNAAACGIDGGDAPQVDGGVRAADAVSPNAADIDGLRPGAAPVLDSQPRGGSQYLAAHGRRVDERGAARTV